MHRRGGRRQTGRSRGVRGQLKLGETQAGAGGSKEQWEGLLVHCFLAAVRGGRCQRGTPRPDILAKAYTALQKSLGPKHITEARLTQRVGGEQRSRENHFLAQDEASLDSPEVGGTPGKVIFLSHQGL